MDPNKNVVEQLNDPSLWPLTPTLRYEGNDPSAGYMDLVDRFVPMIMRACEVHPVMTFYDRFVKVGG